MAYSSSNWRKFSRGPNRQSFKRTYTGSRIPGPEIVARNTFKYRPLSGDTSIRILTLCPGVRGDPLTAHLAEEELGNLEAPYEAISYVWGTGTRCAELRFPNVGNGRGGGSSDDNVTILPLTESIDDALHRLRLPDRPRRLWADQICINQADIAERSQQVRLMNAIYRGAQRVLVWLGRDTEGVAPDAVRMVRYLHRVFQDEEAHDEFRRRHSDELVSQSQDPWVPLAKLTKLPWFTRIWIVQEIGTSTPATLFWGEAEIDWDELSAVATVLNVSYHYLRTRFHVFTPGIGYLYQRFVEPDQRTFPSTSQSTINGGPGESHRGSFVYELHRARHLSSKDPRDYIYAFLGHYSLHNERRGGGAADDGANEGGWATEGEGLAGIEPDYSRPVADVYTDVAVRALTNASSLILLSACHNLKSTNRAARVLRRRIRLPSWVPDWRMLPLHVLCSPDTPHRACGEEGGPYASPQLRIHRGANLLDIKGVRVDTVARCWTPFHGFSFQMRSGRTPSPPPPPPPPPRSSSSSSAISSTCTASTSTHQRRPSTDPSPSSSPSSSARRIVPPLPSLWTDMCRKPPSITLDELYVDGETPALFALLHTLTNACIGAERARRLADHPEADWLANGAAYLVSSAATATHSSSYSRVTISPELRALAERGTPYKWSHEATLVSRYRSFAVSERGYYILGPDVMEPGDVVAVLYGGQVPFVLRPYGNWWKLLGECYMHGVMAGEAFDMNVDEQVFTIS